MIPLLLVAAAYFVGAVPVGVLVGRAYGVDIRATGSGNIGTANVLRALGRRAGLLTFAGDFLKGFLPILVARYLVVGEPWTIATGLATLVGASYSVFLRGAGGKAVATSLGVLTALTWEMALLGLLIYVPVVAITRFTSVGALIAAVVLPVAAFLRYEQDIMPNRFQFIVFMALLVVWRHRENVRRLFAGTERKLGEKPSG